VPDDITNVDQLMQYFQRWKPAYPPGTYRTYSNISIGMLGMIAAKSMNADFVALMEGKLFPALGLKSTYLEIPQAQKKNYAQGYTRTDIPTRMTQGVLSMEAYGIKTTAGDLLRFVDANIGVLDLDQKLRGAITETHTGYFQIGVMTQDLIWEQLHEPVDLKTLLEANSDKMILQANPADKLDPPSPPSDDVLINKTGSTNGFGAYVAFVPAKKIGIALLANKNYPISARVTAVHAIRTHLDVIRNLGDTNP
jgi:beta-lactamase class C